MKKVLLAIAVAGMITTANAQQKNIQSASNSLRNKEYKEAVEFIDLAIKDPSTQSNPKAWATRGQIYLAMDQDPGYADKDYYKEAIASYIKVMELKPNYETEQVNKNLMYGAYKSYNQSVVAYNSKKYDVAYEAAKTTVDIHQLEGGKRFAGEKNFDTVATGAMVIQAYSAFYSGQLDKALPVLEMLKNNPIEGNSANTYIIIADAYEKKGNQAKELATLEEARKRFPGNVDVRNKELNFYIRTGQQDKLLLKLEEAVKSEPNNATYQYNLANAYTNMAFPKTTDGKAGKKPANYDELITKAEAGFEKAISIEPDNIGYHYDMGVLYFNQASNLTDMMNDVPPADDKKYNELKALREEKFNKAHPHLEKIFTTYESKYKSLDADNKFMYRSSLTALREMYALQNKLDKAAEMKKKYEEVNK